MSRIVFLDTECTGLGLHDDIWEIAAIMRDLDADGNPQEQEVHFFVEHDEHKCARLPESFRADHQARFPSTCSARIVTRSQASYRIHQLTDGAHIVGAVPNFDTERLALMLREHNLTPRWHYHLICVEALAVGWIHGRYGTKDEAERQAVSLPWRSDDLSHACGVEPPGDGVRHTAMGDARWARDLYDAIVGGAE